MRRIFPIAIVTVLALVGCSSPEPAPTTPPAAVETPVASATPTTEPVIAAPGSRIPLECDALVVDDLAKRVVGKAAKAITTDVTTTHSVYTAASDQVGVLTCNWEGAKRSLYLSAIVDGKKMFDRVMGFADNNAVDNTVGDASRISCYIYEKNYAQCDLSVLTGEYWMNGLYSISGKDLKKSALVADLEELLSDATVALAAAGEPLPKWTAEVESTIAYGECDALDPNGAVAAAYGEDAKTFVPREAGSGDQSALSTLAWQRAQLLGCEWSASGESYSYRSFYASYVPGSGWAWKYRDSREGKSIAVAGADEAFGECSDGSCNAQVLYKDSWLVFNYNSSNPTKIAHLIKGIEALLPELPLRSTT